MLSLPHFSIKMSFISIFTNEFFGKFFFGIVLDQDWVAPGCLGWVFMIKKKCMFHIVKVSSNNVVGVIPITVMPQPLCRWILLIHHFLERSQFWGVLAVNGSNRNRIALCVCMYVCMCFKRWCWWMYYLLVWVVFHYSV